MAPELDAWPPLPIADWADTYATLHMWMQIVGKIRLALAPRMNHWWQVPLYLTSRGMTTSPMPYGRRSLEILFDFVGHTLVLETSDGRRETIRLAPQSVAEFYRRVMAALLALDVDVRIWPMPVEIPEPIRFDRDEQHASYDPEQAHRMWRITASAGAVLTEFRARFIGKSSPVHFFWGSFDLAVTRFNGKRTDARANADPITREAYSHEVISAGFWPGRLGVIDAAFYAYAFPEPDGFKSARVGPAAAFYSGEFGEFFLKYEDMRSAPSPRDALLEFLQTTYDAGATLGKWNRAELERS